MNDQQFHIFIQEIQICKTEIIEKLEEIRCGIIDVESEAQTSKETALLCPMCKGRKQIDKIEHNLWSPGDRSCFCDCILCDGKGFVQ